MIVTLVELGTATYVPGRWRRILKYCKNTLPNTVNDKNCTYNSAN